MQRCQVEIDHVESQLRAGNRDVAGLCLALNDWNQELRLIEKEIVRAAADG